MSSFVVQSPGIVRPMLRVALPVLAEQVLHMLVGFSDTILAGKYLGGHELAAMGMLNYLLWFLYTLFGVVAVGATAMVARFVGAGDRELACRVMHQALWIGTALAVLIGVGGFLLADELVWLLQLRGEPAALAARFLRVVLCAVPWIMIEEVGMACLRGAGDTVAGLVAMAYVNAVNIAVTWTLVPRGGDLFGGFDASPLLTGWDALALGAVLGNITGGTIVLVMLARGRAGLRLRARQLAPDAALVRRVLRIGVPGGADQLSIVMCHLWYVSIVNRLGEVASAAHGIGVRIESLAYLPGFAFQVAAATLVGQYLGARDPRRAARSVGVTLAVGGGIMLSAGGLLFFAPLSLVRTFVAAEQAEVITLASTLLPIVALAMPSLAGVSILGGALRGAGDTRWLLAITWFGLVVVRIPLAHYLAFDVVALPAGGGSIDGWNLGAVGAWYAMFADATVRCALVVWRFVHGGWKLVMV